MSPTTERRAAPGQVLTALLDTLNAAREQDISAGLFPNQQGWRRTPTIVQDVLSKGIPTGSESLATTLRRLLDEGKVERRGRRGTYEWRRVSNRGRLRLEGPPPAPITIAPPPQPPATGSQDFDALIAGWTQFSDLVAGTTAALVLGKQHRQDAQAARDAIQRLEQQRDEALALAAEYETQAREQARAAEERAAALIDQRDQARAELAKKDRALQRAEQELARLQPLKAKAENLDKVLRRMRAAARDLGIDPDHLEELP